jgi:hypothetical protein
MGSHDEIGRPLAPCAAHTPPLARPALRRQIPEVGAECSNWARSDLSGGRSAMGTGNLLDFCNMDGVPVIQKATVSLLFPIVESAARIVSAT